MNPIDSWVSQNIKGADCLILLSCYREGKGRIQILHFLVQHFLPVPSPAPRRHYEDRRSCVSVYVVKVRCLLHKRPMVPLRYHCIILTWLVCWETSLLFIVSLWNWGRNFICLLSRQEHSCRDRSTVVEAGAHSKPLCHFTHQICICTLTTNT